MSTSTTARPVRDLPRKILVAVDFGTTFSGLAWAQTRRPENPAVIQQWPNAIQTDEKVPTTIKYDHIGYKWGYELEDGSPRYEWFKLGLDFAQETQSELASNYPSPNSLSVQSEDVCKRLTIDYLTALRKHAESKIRSHLFLERIPIEYIITVPAVWSDTAMSRTFSCARAAGMGDEDTLQIISEPEAAGIYALENFDSQDLEIGDTFVVCDAGGGTVDLVSYTITALRPVPRIQEVVAGTGKMCGSIFLNRIFASYMEAKFGNSPFWNPTIKADAVEEFDRRVKRNFKGDITRSYSITMPGFPDDPGLGIAGYRLTLRGSEVRIIFEPVVREVLQLVRGQIRETERLGKHVKAILMVGGFGSNPYLQSRIESEVGQNILVREVMNSWTAVVRGALLAGLAGLSPAKARILVDSRVVRQHYGTSAYTKFEYGIHDIRKREPDPFGAPGSYRIRIMHWFVEKRASVKESEPKRFSYYWDQPASQGPPGEIPMIIYTSEDARPPLYKTDGVSECVTLRADLRQIPENQLHKETGADGHVHYKINYEIEMARYSAKLKFALIYKDTKYHIVEAKFE